MLELYYVRRKNQVRLEQNHLATIIETAACRFVEQGYPIPYGKANLMYMAYFGDWLRDQQVTVDKVTAEHGQDFLRQFVPPKFRGQPERVSPLQERRALLAAIRLALALIHERHPVATVFHPAQIEVGRYVDHLRRDRGLAEGTVEHHERCLGEFLTHCFGDEPIDIAWLTADRIHAYIDALPASRTNARRRIACTVLRGYFRFLELHGLTTRYLHAVVPTVASSRPAVSPKVLEASDLKKLLASIDRSTPTGKRDYAAVLCMCDLGLRVGDLPRLTLDDIDWRRGSVQVANHKMDRPYRLPLPRRVGRALADYLAHGRPASACRQIFVRHGRPIGQPTTAHALKVAVYRLWDKSGQHDRFSGTHILRHSAATRMKRAGVTLKSIADVLGHGSLQTTVLYAQVDLPALRAAAQPWPEVQP